MNPQFTERNLVRLIRLVERYTSTAIGKMLEEEGYAPLTARHLQVFESIDPNGSNIVQMAKNAHLSKQAMSKLVKEVTAVKLLEVGPNKEDSRFIIVRLTPKGRDFHQNVLPKFSAFYDKLMVNEAITSTDMATVTDTLLRFLKHFEATNAPIEG
jgi:DNA-binding MarR family transcriptional regulator